jgi:hypothetical protein
MRRVRHVVLVSAAAAGLCLSQGAQGAGPLALNVTFFANDTIAVTLADGTPVGTTSGSPTVIPAGFYTVQISGPMGLPNGLPYFQLTGPGVDLLSNLNEGGVDSARDQVTFATSSTYSWTDDAIPGVVHTFVTSSDVGGAAPATAVSPKKGTPTQDQDIVGSAVVPTRATLTATVSASGRPSILLAGAPAGNLLAGTYRIAITDRSPRAGLVVAVSGSPGRKLSGVRFVGKRSVSVRLTPGRWTFAAGGGRESIVVR